MRILAHRGFWTSPEEKNSELAFRRAKSAGFGIETDFRDRDGIAVLSHDPPLRETRLSSLGAHLAEFRPSFAQPLAINIKADGLCQAVKNAVLSLELGSYFVFDASIPDTLHYMKAAVPTFLRLSEFEPWTALHDCCDGLWVDQMDGQWFGFDDLQALSAKGKPLCFVSPELHGRSHLEFFSFLRQARAQASGVHAVGIHAAEKWMVCTDHPVQAEEFFNAQN